MHVMVVNFSHEESVLQKGTVLSVAEETFASTVAAFNEEGTSNFRSTREKHRKVYMVVNDTSFKEYLQDKLGHLSPAERSVMEPTLIKYLHIFHEEGSNDFRGTDLVEHKIVSGNAKPIRKHRYRVPFALRKEMENQIDTMLRKGVIEASSSPWYSSVILVPKKSLEGMPKYRL